jgi:hypothetical protein
MRLTIMVSASIKPFSYSGKNGGFQAENSDKQRTVIKNNGKGKKLGATVESPLRK